MSSTTARSYRLSAGGSPSATMRRSVATISMAALLAVSMGSAALAATDDTRVAVDSGGLSMDTITVGDFTTVEIGSNDQTTSATLGNFNVRDFRGTGEGWRLTAHATRFAEWDDLNEVYVPNGATLAVDSLLLAAPTITAVGDTDSPGPTFHPHLPLPIDGGTGLMFSAASENDGMGEYTYAFGDLSLNIPTDVAAGYYRSVVTITLATTP